MFNLPGTHNLQSSYGANFGSNSSANRVVVDARSCPTLSTVDENVILPDSQPLPPMPMYPAPTELTVSSELLIPDQEASAPQAPDQSGQTKRTLSCCGFRTQKVSSLCCSARSDKSLLKKINKDYKALTDRWLVMNQARCALRAATVDGGVRDRHFYKAAELLTGSAFQKEYTTLFKINDQATQLIDITVDTLPRQSGFFSFVTRSGLPMETVYVSMTGEEPLLFNCECPTLDTALSPVTKPQTAATMLAYSMNEPAVAALRTWVQTNDYLAHWLSCEELAQQVEVHPAPEVSSYEFHVKRLFKVEFDGTTLLVRGHGDPSLSSTPLGLMTGKNLVKYLLEHHGNDIGKATQIDLRMCNSGKGGSMRSQAQVLANGLGKAVVGYTGPINSKGESLAEIEPENFRVVYYPQTSGVRRLMVGTMNHAMGRNHRARLLRRHPSWRSTKDN